MMRRFLATLLVTLVLLAALGTVASSSGEYSLSVSETVDIPDRQITVNGSTFTIRSVARADTDTTLSVTANAPADTDYNVYLIDGERRIVEATSGNGSEEVTLRLSGIDPGSFAITIYKGWTRAVFPLVVRGWAVTQEAPDTVHGDRNVTIEIDLSAVDDEAGVPHRVRTIIWNDHIEREVTATKTGDETYDATLSLADLADGSYKLVTIVESDTEAFGRNAAIGISDAATIELTEPTATATPTDTATPARTTAEPTSSATATDRPDSDDDGSQPSTDSPTPGTTTEPETPMTTTTRASPSPTDRSATVSPTPETSSPTASTGATATDDGADTATVAGTMAPGQTTVFTRIQVDDTTATDDGVLTPAATRATTSRPITRSLDLRLPEIITVLLLGLLAIRRRST